MPTAKESAAPPEVPDVVYDWLVHELAFPFDTRTQEKPEWLDVRTLATVWASADNETVENYEQAIYWETGWGA